MNNGPITVWWARVPEETQWLSSYACLLSDEENARSQCFVQDRSRRHFIAGRIIARTILGDMLGERPESLCLKRLEAGRPYLDRPYVDFNLSHSGDVITLVVSCSGQVGIDTERILPNRDRFGGDIDFLQPVELDHAKSYPAPLHKTLLIKYWVAKESVVKAVGLAGRRQMKKVDLGCLFLDTTNTTTMISYDNRIVRAHICFREILLGQLAAITQLNQPPQPIIWRNYNCFLGANVR